MNSNGERREPPDFSHYYENRNKLPLEEYVKYAGKQVAFSPDGSRIVASGDTLEELDKALEEAGIHFSQVVTAYMDPPDVSCI